MPSYCVSYHNTPEDARAKRMSFGGFDSAHQTREQAEAQAEVIRKRYAPGQVIVSVTERN